MLNLLLGLLADLLLLIAWSRIVRKTVSVGGPLSCLFRLRLACILSALLLTGLSFLAWNGESQSSGILLTDQITIPWWVFLFSSPLLYWLYLAVNCFFGRYSSGSLDRWYKEVNNEWILKKQWGTVQVLTYKASAVLLVFVCLLSLFPANSGVWMVIPASASLILRVYSLLLGGTVEQLQIRHPVEEKKEPEITANLRDAAAALAESFPSALLCRKEVHVRARHENTEMILRRLERSRSFNELTAASYYRSLGKGKNLDADLVQISLGMLNGNHTLIRNPFYKDLGEYLALPLNESLGKGNKVLVLCMGEKQAKNISLWMENILDPQALFQDRWRIKVLNNLRYDGQIGILNYSSLYDPEVLRTNGTFFSQVEYVVMLQPSTVLSTSQTALSVLSDALESPVYCVLDRDLRGLKDTLSHTLKISFSSDLYMSQAAQLQTLMVFDSYAKYHTNAVSTRYFGAGIDLGATAVKAGSPSVTWISERSIPVLDMQNSAASSWRYLSDLMNCDTSQVAVKERLRVDSSLWSTKQQNSQFLIVEDEFCNPYAMVSNYMSRGKEETALVVLSNPYLLREYFADNADRFLNNQNAFPSLAPDYVRSPRNILLKLILKMLQGPVTTGYIQKELDICGIQTDKPVEDLIHLLEQYTNAEETLFVIGKRKRMIPFSEPEVVTTVGVNPVKFEEYFSNTLKSVSYVLEDEQTGKNILDTKLFSLIPQTLLPGQVFVCEGCRYLVQRISSEHGVILQRASDREEERRMYSQIRQYFLPAQSESPDVMYVRSQTKHGIRFDRIETDFHVTTTGYMEFKSSEPEPVTVDCSLDPSWSSFDRHYTSKQILYIRFPETDQEKTESLKSLLESMLVSVFPGAYPYLALLSHSDVETIPASTMAVVEDSEMDLGLLDAFENVFFELLAVVDDYVQWLERKNNEKDQPEFTESDAAESAEEQIVQMQEEQKRVDEETEEAGQ
ncbi:hypothetical protein [Faecalibaculum rodentium]|uniref:hypothetical protein n=1 Tax=Faecalibaculum rodentium TaxID=1702221 RepID=UPI00256EDE50|nr:hypothetical protein [Faecalibaculum rodentium]